MLFASLIVSTALLGQAQAPSQLAPPGELVSTGSAVRCPLERTTVVANIAGMGARVTVRQTFRNPSTKPIEAIYTFPLSEKSAVDRMKMVIGTRTVIGQIKRRDEAKAIYEAARNAGQAAALLNQERPNIFTQSVANIAPGAKIDVEISYVELLKFDSGEFEFAFPMVVGPRYLGHTPDPQKVTPPIVPNLRNGANISIDVNVDAGAKIQSLNSVQQPIKVERPSERTAHVALKNADEIPNKDFILRYTVATNEVKDALLTYRDPQKGGFFTLILMPPKRPSAAQIAPKEMIFVMDQSGSQAGMPIEKSKELTLRLLDKMNPHDTFNVISFSNDVRWAFPQSLPRTPDNVARAKAFVSGLDASGGTELCKAVEAALGSPDDPMRVRYVVFNTDGFIGNEGQILKAIQDHRGESRMFTFGIGSSVNRYLVESMSSEGKGLCEVVTLNTAVDKVVDDFAKTLSTPVLTDVAVDIDGLDVYDVFPRQIPDVMRDRPVVVTGRFRQPGQGQLRLRGRLGQEEWSQSTAVNFPAESTNSNSLMSLWARQKVDDLTRSDYVRTVSGSTVDATGTQKEIERIGLDYSIMTAFTSFVAVDTRISNRTGKVETVPVPVPLADGLSADRFAQSGAPMSTAGNPGLIAGGGRRAGGSFASAAKTEEKEDLARKSKNISAPAIDAMITVRKVDAATLKAIRALGLTVTKSEPKRKIVWVRGTAVQLKALSHLKAVLKIEPKRSG